jgi:hypothetical protein
MGLGDIFGFGKEEQKPFKIPREVTALRIRIEAENRENFPSLVRYKEMIKDAELVYKNLNDMIKNKEHVEEAIRIREDIKKRMEGLAEKIYKNIRESKKEGKEDYVEKKIDYLERKSIRNQAKTLFTEILLEVESIITFCKEGRLEHERTIDSAMIALIKTISELNNNFFKEHGGDKEIKGLKEQVLKRMSDLSNFFKENKACLKEKGLEVEAESNLKKIHEMIKKLSD